MGISLKGRDLPVTITCLSAAWRRHAPTLFWACAQKHWGVLEECRGRVTRVNVPLLAAQISESLCRDHPLDHLRFVINYEMRVALHHRERFVSKYVGDFKQ